MAYNKLVLLSVLLPHTKKGDAFWNKFDKLQKSTLIISIWDLAFHPVVKFWPLISSDCPFNFTAYWIKLHYICFLSFYCMTQLSDRACPCLWTIRLFLEYGSMVIKILQVSYICMKLQILSDEKVLRPCTLNKMEWSCLCVPPPLVCHHGPG